MTIDPLSGVGNMASYLNINSITSITAGAFSGLTYLYLLNLYSNSISSIAIGTFSNLPYMGVL